MFVCISLTYFARARAVAALANSLGCMLAGPIKYHDVAPFTLFPRTNSPR